MAENKTKKIRLGSGKLYAAEVSSDLPTKEELCKKENQVGDIQGGATLEYKPSYYTAKDDLGYAEKTIITEEEATLKTGVMTFNAENLKMLCATGRVVDSTDGKTRTLKIGGINNADGKKYAICFHHEDKVDGDVWIIIVGQNQNGFSLAFAKDKETIIDAEFKALVQDDEGTLIQYIEEIKGADEAAPATQSEAQEQDTTQGKSTAKS